MSDQLTDIELSYGLISDTQSDDQGWNPLELSSLGILRETVDWGVSTQVDFYIDSFNIIKNIVLRQIKTVELQEL